MLLVFTSVFLTLKKGATKSQLEHLRKKINGLGFRAHISKGAKKIVVGVIGENAILARDTFESMDIVDFITPISKPYKLASREFKKEDTIINVNGIKIGAVGNFPPDFRFMDGSPLQYPIPGGFNNCFKIILLRMYFRIAINF